MIILGKYDEFAPNMGFPSIREYLQNEPYKFQEAVLQYLMSGNIHMVTASRFSDVITGELTDRELVYMDDGEYSWSSKLPYYVEKYNLRLPEDFDQHVLEKRNPFKIIIKLRKGETVECPQCKEAIIKATGEYQTAHEYRCQNEKCNFRILLD